MLSEQDKKLIEETHRYIREVEPGLPTIPESLLRKMQDQVSQPEPKGENK